MGVNNLPRVAAWRCTGRELNLGPLGLESNTLTTTPPSHPHISVVWNYCIENVRYSMRELKYLLRYSPSTRLENYLDSTALMKCGWVYHITDPSLRHDPWHDVTWNSMWSFHEISVSCKLCLFCCSYISRRMISSICWNSSSPSSGEFHIQCCCSIH